MKTWFFIILLLSIIGISEFSIQMSHGQIDNDSNKINEQITFSDDLLLDPIAQDILKKIEETKKWIADLEQKQFEENQAKQNLEEMRVMSIERLNQDLKEWERLWEKHSSRNAFESFVSKKPEYVRGVFWDQFEFKEQKVKAGREALKQVLLSGGSLKDARNAYNNAAQTKKIELIEMNAQFNVKHELAYYGQQQLFNSTGQFHPSQVSQIKLIEYYTDYRQDPAYLLANPDDEHSAKYGSSTTSDTECRDGYVVVHRLNKNDYSCITESTAQMWERSGIGKIVNKESSQTVFDENSLISNVKTNPGTQCKEGFSVLYDTISLEYHCISDSIVKESIKQGTGEVHDLIQYILEKDQYKKVLDKIYEINQEILRINEEYAIKQVQLESQYTNIFNNIDASANQSEKEILKMYHSDEAMSNEDLSNQIIIIRNAHESQKEETLEEKITDMSKLELALKDKMLNIAKRYENNSDIKVTWNTDRSTYEAVTRR